MTKSPEQNSFQTLFKPSKFKLNLTEKEQDLLTDTTQKLKGLSENEITEHLEHLSYHLHYWYVHGFDKSHIHDTSSIFNTQVLNSIMHKPNSAEHSEDLSIYNEDSSDFNFKALIFYLQDQSSSNPFLDHIPTRQDFKNIRELKKSAEKRGYSLQDNLQSDNPDDNQKLINLFYSKFNANFEQINKEHLASEKIFANIYEKFESNINLDRKFHTRSSYSTDATDLMVEIPIAVFYPTSNEEIREMISLAKHKDAKFNLLARGGGVGITGGAVPLAEQTIVMSMEKMNSISKVEEVSLDNEQAQKYIITGAGANTLAVDEYANIPDKYGKTHFFAVDPASKKGSSVGGNLAEGAGGNKAVEFGSAIDNALAWQMIRPDGQTIVVKRLSPLPVTARIPEDGQLIFGIFDGDTALTPYVSSENSKKTKEITLRGDEIRRKGIAKDVMKKHLGGLPGMHKEGTDGVITNISWAVHEKMKESKTFFIQTFNFPHAHKMMMEIFALRDEMKNKGDNSWRVMECEHWDAVYADIVEQKQITNEKNEMEFPQASWMLDLGADNPELFKAVETIFKKYQSEDSDRLLITEDTDGSGKAFRGKTSGISKHTNGFKLNDDFSVRIEDQVAFNELVMGLNSKYAKLWEDKKKELLSSGKYTEDQTFKDSKFIVAWHAHYGDGNCHFNIPLYSQFPEMIHMAEEIIELMFEEIMSDKFQGTVTAEHGIGITKLPILGKLWRKYESDSKTSGDKNPYKEFFDDLKSLKGYNDDIDPDKIWHTGALDYQYYMKKQMLQREFTVSNQKIIDALTQERDRRLKNNFNNKNYPNEIFDTMIELIENFKMCVKCGKCKPSCERHAPQADIFMSPHSKNFRIRSVLMEFAEHLIRDPNNDIPKSWTKGLRDVAMACTACGSGPKHSCEVSCPVDIDTAGTVGILKRLLNQLDSAQHTFKEKAADFALSHEWTRKSAELAAPFLEQIPVDRDFNPLGSQQSNVIQAFKESGLAGLLNRNNPKYLESNTSSEDGKGGKTVILHDGVERHFAKDDFLAAIFLLNYLGNNILLSNQNPDSTAPAFHKNGEFNSKKQEELKAIIDGVTKIARDNNLLKADSPAPVTLEGNATIREGLTAALSSEVKSSVLVILNQIQNNSNVIDRIKQGLNNKQYNNILFQKPCHEDQDVLDIIKNFVEEILDKNFINSEQCCGNDGGKAPLNLKRLERRTKIMNSKLHWFNEVQADVGVSTCESGCVSQLANTSKAAEKPFDTMSFLTLLASAIDPNYGKTIQTKMNKNVQYLKK